MRQLHVPAFLHSPSSETRTSRERSAFTLVELLIVIAIIAILAGLAFPAVQGALNSGKKAQARNDVQQIAAAIRAYQLEYGRLPSSVTSPGDGDEDFLGKDRSKEVIGILTGENTSNLNPQGRAFLEAKTTTSRKGGIDPSDKTFYDPWGEPYLIKLDTSYNNKLEYYSTGGAANPNVFSSVIVISTGPNKTQDDPNASGSDEIVSFK